MTTIERELWAAIQNLSADQQAQVMTFVRNLGSGKGKPIQEIFQHAKEIAFPKEDLAEIKQFIEETFERVEGDELDAPTFSA